MSLTFRGNSIEDVSEIAKLKPMKQIRALILLGKPLLYYIVMLLRGSHQFVTMCSMLLMLSFCFLSPLWLKKVVAENGTVMNSSKSRLSNVILDILWFNPSPMQRILFLNWMTTALKSWLPWMQPRT